jgi:ABC-type Fe3+/spermidine/putrescine transport system ATPase subunit
MIALAGLRKAFGAVVAVDDVSLSVRQGEFLAVLGPSGCGKTTLLRLIGGYDRPDAGSVQIDGREVSGLPPEQRNVGMVFQKYALFPHLTVLENVEFGLKMRRVEKRERRRRAVEALAFVNLPGMEDRYPATLSGGQQQRVSLARALVVSPSVLLLDEPLASLDRQIREQMRAELRALQQRLSITTIFVTHDQEEALTMADRIAVMEKGRFHQCGTPVEICVRPASRFVESFFGLALNGREPQ